MVPIIIGSSVGKGRREDAAMGTCRNRAAQVQGIAKEEVGVFRDGDRRSEACSVRIASA